MVGGKLEGDEVLLPSCMSSEQSQEVQGATRNYAKPSVATGGRHVTER